MKINKSLKLNKSYSDGGRLESIAKTYGLPKRVLVYDEDGDLDEEATVKNIYLYISDNRDEIPESVIEKIESLIPDIVERMSYFEYDGVDDDKQLLTNPEFASDLSKLKSTYHKVTNTKPKSSVVLVKPAPKINLKLQKGSSLQVRKSANTTPQEIIKNKRGSLSYKAGGKLNQGDKPMEFVKSKTNRDHTLDGYELKNNKLIPNRQSSVRGYLKPVDNTDGMKQYGKNLYSKMKKGGLVYKTKEDRDMVEGIIDMIKKVKDSKNRKLLADDMLKKFKRESIEIDESEFLKKVL